MGQLHPIVPCLWFDSQAEEAATFYTTVFKNSKLGRISRYTEAGKEVHGRPPGSAMTVEFELEGMKFTALNGGPHFKFTEAVSFQIMCDTQDEIDYFWEKLKEGGDPKAQQCGWLKDKFGLSWQVVPAAMGELMKGPGASGAMHALLKMKKLDIAELRKAAAGGK
jgi:predicted 3-demethylubiquinone-9 3-methyltransferase (glyoxalase superfamily)